MLIDLLTPVCFKNMKINYQNALFKQLITFGRGYTEARNLWPVRYMSETQTQKLGVSQ